jgi:hypothetical protein
VWLCSPNLEPCSLQPFIEMIVGSAGLGSLGLCTLDLLPGDGSFVQSGLKILTFRLGSVTHICNPGHSGSRDHDCSSRPAQAKS